MTDATPRALYEAVGPLLAPGWRDAAPWGYPHQAELAVIAGVFRAQVPQAGADAVVDMVMRSRPSALLDDLGELASLGPDGVTTLLGPRWGDTNVLGVTVLRTHVIYAAAAALVGVGVHSGADLREAALSRPQEVEDAVLAVRGLGRGTWGWIGTLAHARIRPDADLVALVTRLSGATVRLSAEETTDLLVKTARLFASDERTLSHAVREVVASTAA